MAQGNDRNLNIVEGPWKSLKSGDGGGTFDGMEARVARLEASAAHLERDMGEVRADTRDIRDRLVRIEERLAHLPGAAQLWGAGATIVALIFGALALLPWFYALVGVAPK